MEVRIGKADFLEVVISGGLLSKRETNCVPRAVELGISLAKVESNVELTESCEAELRQELETVFKVTQIYWNRCGRRTNRLLSKHSSFYSGEIVAQCENEQASGGAEAADGRQSRSSAGRHAKPYAEQSERSKRRASKELSKEHDATKLIKAAHQKSRAEGKTDLSFVLKQAAASPSRPRKMRRALRQSTSSKSATCATPNKALAMCVASDLTVHGYQVVRNAAHDAAQIHVFPSYHKVRSAKKECYPMTTEMEFSDTSAQVTLQALLDHTVRRLAEAHGFLENIDRPIDEPGPSVETISGILEVKWGFDGATSQSIYKQAINPEDESSEESLFCTTIVPLRLRVGDSVMWRNRAPSSTRLCRPLCVRYRRETAEVSREEQRRIEAEIAQLRPTVLMTSRGVRVEVSHQLQLTMVDGKVVGALTDTKSSASCTVCGATPRQMNDLSAVSARPVRTDTYQYGLSTMHAWIRVFECVIHVSYRLTVKTWAVGSKHKDAVSERKKQVQRRFREEMSLVVDQPKAGGSGTTNDGNTARRAFQDVDKLGDVTDVDKELLQRFAVILTALSSCSPIDVEKYAQYAMETAQLFVTLYPWYYMPASVHKLLVHGADVIESLVLPIGMYSEEVQEARNKHNRQYRLSHSRKTSRKDTMQDQFNYLLVSSDPVITSIIESDINQPRRRRTSGPSSRKVDISQLLRDVSEGESEWDSDDDDDYDPV